MCQPQCIILQTDINLCLAVLCLVYYNLILFVHDSILFKMRYVKDPTDELA